MSTDTVNLEAVTNFQATLLNVLHAGGTPNEMREKIAAAAEGAGLAAYVAGFDDRMLIVASELVRKWGAKSH